MVGHAKTMIPYKDVTSELSEEWHSDVDEIVTILFKSSMTVFFFGTGVGLIFAFRDYITGIGNDTVSIVSTSMFSLLVLYVGIDWIIGITRASVIDEEYNFRIDFQNPIYDLLKGIMSIVTGFIAIRLAISSAPSTTNLSKFVDFSFLRPFSTQLILSSLVVFSVVLLIIGVYLIVGQMVFLKYNYQAMRHDLRQSS